MDEIFRVLHLVISLECGGLEQLVVKLVIKRNKRYPSSTFICCLDKTGELGSQLPDDVVFSLNANRSKLPWDYQAVVRLKDWIKSCSQPFSSLILHAHNVAAWQYAVLAARETGAKVVYTQHGANIHNIGIKNRLRSIVLSWFTDRIITVSNHTALSMVRHLGIPRRKIVVIHNGVDINQLQENSLINESTNYRERFGIPPESFIIGSVGRFSPEKNYSLLIRAFHALVTSYRFPPKADSAVAETSGQEDGQKPNSLQPIAYRLLLLGDGPERGKLEKLIKDLGIEDKVIMPGMQADVLPWLEQMDVFCLSSKTEGLSISALEAGSLGIPLVMTDVGGCSEITDGNNCGIIVPPDNERALVDAFVHLREDETRRKELGEKIKERVRSEFSLNRMSDEYEKVYEGLGKAI